MKKYLIRVLLSPLIFAWGLFLLAAMTLFPLTMLVMMSFVGFLICPFIYLLKLGGSEIEYMDAFIDITKYNIVNHLLGLTIHIWGAFAITYIYIKTGEIFTGE